MSCSLKAVSCITLYLQLCYKHNLFVVKTLSNPHFPRYHLTQSQINDHSRCRLDLYWIILTSRGVQANNPGFLDAVYKKNSCDSGCEGRLCIGAVGSCVRFWRGDWGPITCNRNIRGLILSLPSASDILRYILFCRASAIYGLLINLRCIYKRVSPLLVTLNTDV